MKFLKTDFEEALHDHKCQQRENINQALNESEKRFEIIKAALLSAEKNAAEASAKASFAEEKLTESTKKVQMLEAENKQLRADNTRLIEESTKSLTSAHIESYVCLYEIKLNKIDFCIIQVGTNS